jgi:hypothetical protein
MKIHTTNYTDTFITVAEDCPATMAEIPSPKGDAKTIASLQFDMISQHPYQFTSDDVIFEAYAIRHDLSKSEYEQARKDFFSKGQACLRSSPLAKRYGWGFHHDAAGKVALVGVGTERYNKMAADKSLQVVKAMRTKKG